jgi:hypothetical protein
VVCGKGIVLFTGDVFPYWRWAGWLGLKFYKKISICIDFDDLADGLNLEARWSAAKRALMAYEGFAVGCGEKYDGVVAESLKR